MIIGTNYIALQITGSTKVPLSLAAQYKSGKSLDNLEVIL